MTLTRARRAASTTFLVSSMLLGGCSPRTADGGESTSGEVAAEAPEAERVGAQRHPTHVDSIFPIEEHVRRFREGLMEPPGLTGGARSREALIARFATALAARDTAAFADMLLTRAEFAWLYYPHTRFTMPPYRLAPEILWMQIGNGSSQGFGRLLDRLGGTLLDPGSHRCDPEPTVEGPNRTWERCVVRVARDGAEVDMRLFGSILERDGVFKFVSYTNDF